MTTLDVMQNELKCIKRNINNHCDRKCANCDLVLPDDDIILAYEAVITMLKDFEDDLK